MSIPAEIPAATITFPLSINRFVKNQDGHPARPVFFRQGTPHGIFNFSAIVIKRKRTRPINKMRAPELKINR